MGHRAWHTFAKLPVCALINDLKKKFWKKLYVTIPQWFEAFRNMSHLPSGWNRAKCGLQLNDPIGWSKLRLNQPFCESKKFGDKSTLLMTYRLDVVLLLNKNQWRIQEGGPPLQNSFKFMWCIRKKIFVSAHLNLGSAPHGSNPGFRISLSGLLLQWWGYQPIILATFSQKLYENEQMFTQRARGGWNNCSMGSFHALLYNRV